MEEGRPRIEVINPRWGGVGMAFVRAVVVVLVWLPVPVGIAGATLVSEFARRAPPAPDVLVPVSGHATEIVGTDGTRLGGLLRGRRAWVRSGQIPAKIKFAFLAAEDDAFYEHDGFDLIAVARAFLRNRAAGRVVEGGSTITQQLAKRFLTNERSYERKLVELFLARRIEASFAKETIYEAYLNEVYLGAGAYGVRAAAEIYFHKNLDELGWAEAALMASLASSPSAFNPFRRPELALKRRRLALLRLVKVGALDEAQARALMEVPLGLRTDWDGDVNTAPYAAVSVRETLRQDFGEEVMQVGSLEVTLSLSTTLQREARRSLALGLRELDRRQGYRGPLYKLPEARWRDLDAAAAEVYGMPSDEAPFEPEAARPYVARVVEVAPRSLGLSLAGRRIEVPYEGAHWASPYYRGSKKNEVPLDDFRTQFEVGDVVLTARDTYGVWDDPPGARRGKAPRQVEGWRLDQLPRVEGALVSAEIDTGYVRAIVGGWDFDRSEYNRALVGCRQPGSVFKPIVYSRALDKGMTPATLLADAPLKVEKAGGEVWKPKNADNDFAGFLIMRDALARSRNLPSIEVFNYVGAKAVAKRAEQLGITTRMARTEALSLGSSCVKPWDMTRVYGTFARRGVRMEPQLLLTVKTSDGHIISDKGHFSDASAPTLARFDRLARAAGARPQRVLHPATAYMMLSMLSAVVYGGTAYAATALGVPAAGKTGTTNAFDAWFIGFTQSVVTSVWVGADNNDRALGQRESGGRVALPVWLGYMRHALADRPQEGVVGSPPDSIEVHRVDRESGLLSKQGEPGVDLPFIVGTAPQLFAPDRKEKAVRKADRHASEF